MPSLSAILDTITIIMVETTLPANIGSTARAMHTMGLSHLTVVKPKLAIDDSSYANAVGGGHLLDTTTIAPDLPSALACHQLIFACSARSRHLPRPTINPQQCANLIGQVAHTANPPKIAIVFGREDRGLTNDELAYADYHVQIPANPAYPVLNVASAVQVIASTIYAHLCQASTPACPLDMTIRSNWDEPAISFKQKQELEHRFIALLTGLNLARTDELKDLPKRLSRLFGRLQLDQKEYALLQALIAKLTAINKTTQ